jgi:hypothetical protein
MLFEVAHSFLDLVFPRTCLGCKELLPANHHLLCPPCLEQMPFTDPEEHCKQCYTFLQGEICNQCYRSPSPFFRCLAPYSGSSSAIALAKGLSHPTGGFLAKSLASLIYVHMEQFSFQPGEWLISASDPGSKRLTSALSHLLNIPALEVIRPASFLHPTPQLKKKIPIALEERQLTFVTLGLRAFADELQEANLLAEAFPRSINALMFSRSLSH